MSIRVALHHQTRYRYDRLVTLSPQLIRLRPAPHARTPITSYSLRVEPRDHFENWQQDPHGNFLARCVFPQPVREFHVEVDLIAQMTVVNPFDFFIEPDAEQWPFEYDPWLAKDLRPFLECEPVGPKLSEWLAQRGPRDATFRRFPRAAQPTTPTANSLCNPFRAGCADSGGDLDHACRFLPRQCLVICADPA